MQELTLSEIAEILMMSKRGVEKKAARQSWPYRTVNLTGGGFARLYNLYDLPQKIQTDIELHIAKHGVPKRTKQIISDCPQNTGNTGNTDIGGKGNTGDNIGNSNNIKEKPFPTKNTPTKNTTADNKTPPITSLPLPGAADPPPALQAPSKKIKKTIQKIKEDEQKQKEKGLIAFNKAPEWNKNIAMARSEILKAYRDYLEKRGSKKVDAIKKFCRIYPKHVDVTQEVKELVNRVSLATLARWQKESSEKGIGGLLTTYKTNKGTFTKLSQEQQDFIVALIGEKPHRRPGNAHKLLHYKFGEVCHQSTVYRYFEDWKKKNKEFYTFLVNPDKWKNEYQAAFGDADWWATYFGYGWEMDSTPADVITSDGKRVAIVGCIDVYSRKVDVIMGSTSNSLLIAGLMRRRLLDWGVPKVIKKDNGKDYGSKHIDTIVKDFDISTPHLREFSPEEKPHIERFFRTLSHGLYEEISGYCGHNVFDRQNIRNRDSFAQRFMREGSTVELPCTASELEEFTYKWIKNVYHQRPHAGLKAKLGVETSPSQRAAQSPIQPKRIEDARSLDILLSPAIEKTVTKKGIRIDNIPYQSIELIQNRLVGQKVWVRPDLADVSQIYVYKVSDTAEMEFMCTANTKLFGGNTLEEYKKAQNSHKKALREKRRAIEIAAKTVPSFIDTLQEVAGELVNINTGEVFENKATKEAQKALKELDRKEKQLKAEATITPFPVGEASKNKKETTEKDLFAEVITLPRAKTNKQTDAEEMDNYDMLNKGLDKQEEQQKRERRKREEEEQRQQSHLPW